MSYFDDYQAHLKSWFDQHEASDAQATEALARAQQETVEVGQERDVFSDALVALRAEFDAYRASHPDVPTGPRLILGASVGGNTDPSDLETRVGTLGCHRTYWTSDQVAAAVAWIAKDLAAGRVPWVTFKFPASWTAMAGGAGDTWARSTLDAVTKALGGKLGYIDFHHEPEGDEAGGGYQGLGAWAQTQARIYAMPRPANLRQAMIFTPWNWVKTNTSPGAWDLNQLFPGALPCDVIACDPYNYFGAYKTKAQFNAGKGELETNFIELSRWTKGFADFAAAKGKAWGVGEWCCTHAAHVRDPDWIERQVRDMIAMDCEISAMFSSILNSRGDWDIRGDTGRETAFARALALAKG